MTSEDEPFDEGLQAERTLLAWRRTCLALVMASALCIRYLLEVFHGWAAVLGAAGLLAALAGWLTATVRYRRAHHGLIHESRLLTGGTLVTVTAAAAVVLSAAGAILVVVHWSPW